MPKAAGCGLMANDIDDSRTTHPHPVSHRSTTLPHRRND